MIKLLRPNHRIFLVTAPTRVLLGRLFVRAQEFYENPSKKFRGRYFELEAFERWYAKRNGGGFTYYRDYGGYNIPGSAFLDWKVAFASNETREEQELVCLLGALPAQFYVIGARERDASTIEHELQHALFHLDSFYRMSAQAAVRRHAKPLRALRRELAELAYHPDVLDDECVSYLLFEQAWLRKHGVSLKPLEALRQELDLSYQSARLLAVKPRRDW